MKEEFKKIKERIFKPIKELDAEIRFIENEQDEEKKVYWVVEVGLVESLGEQGYNYTFFYDSYPTEEEIKEDIKEHIKEEIKKLSDDFCLSWRDEETLKYLKIIEKEGLKE